MSPGGEGVHPSPGSENACEGVQDGAARERAKGTNQQQLSFRPRESYVEASPVSEKVTHGAPSVGSNERHHDDLLIAALILVDGVDLEERVGCLQLRLQQLDLLRWVEMIKESRKRPSELDSAPSENIVE